MDAIVAAQAMLILLGLYIAGWSAVFPRLEAHRTHGAYGEVV